MLPFPDLITSWIRSPREWSLSLWPLRLLTWKENAASGMTKLKVTRKTKHLFRSYSVCFYRDTLPPIIDSGSLLMLRVLYTSGSFLLAPRKCIPCHRIRVASRWSWSTAAWPSLFPCALREDCSASLPTHPGGLLQPQAAAGSGAT